MANPQVVVDFVANTSDLKKGMREAGGASDGFASKLKGIAKGGAIAAGAAGVGALVTTLKIGFDEFQQSQKVMAQTNAVLKSTGGAAGVTADQISNLAGALMKKSGIDDEAIQSGENLLLTFTDVQNKVGKGNDIFNQATKTMTDMSVALGQDMKTSAIQLGKALNNPTKGMTALQRVGVSFTQSQKDQIKALQASGDTMGAQKIILKELQKEFGGSAEAAGKTLPGQINILKESFNNFAGDLVGKLIPYLQLAIAWLRDHWPEISAALSQMWATVQPILVALIDIIKNVVSAIQSNWGTIGPIVNGFVTVLKDAAKVITDVLRIVTDLLRGDWSKAWQDVQKLVMDIVKTLVDFVVLEFKVLTTELGAIWGLIKQAASTAWQGIKDTISGLVQGILDWIKAHWGLIVSILGGPLGAALVQIINHWTDIKNAVINGINTVGSTITGLAKTITGWGSSIGGWILDGVVGGITGVATAVWNVLKNIPSTLLGFKNTIFTWGTDVGGWIKDGIVSMFGAIGSALTGAIKGPINTVVKAWNNLQIPGVKIDLPGPLPTVSAGPWNLPDLPLLAKGGIVTSPTLAMVGEAGPEAVVPLSAGGAIQVRVFIGETELRGLVRSEIVDTNTGIARSLLAGGV